jgi:lysophospholipase L1-like esterase
VGCASSENPLSPSGPPAPGSAIRYTAVGASDANGVGSSSPCFVEDCPTGTGYVQTAARTLRTQGFTVDAANRGLPGAVLSRRILTLGKQYGDQLLFNFTDDEVPFVPKDSTVVTVFAGGNDLNVVRGAIGGGAAGGNVNAFVDQQVLQFTEEFQSLIASIQIRAASARIVVLNLPNLAGLPYLSGASSADRQAAQRFSVGVTLSAFNPLSSRGIPVIDLMCDTRLYQASNISSDGFHPNDAGYAIMAGHVVSAITSASYPQPQNSCSQMSLIP